MTEVDRIRTEYYTAGRRAESDVILGAIETGLYDECFDPQVKSAVERIRTEAQMEQREADAKLCAQYAGTEANGETLAGWIRPSALASASAQSMLERVKDEARLEEIKRRPLHRHSIFLDGKPSKCSDCELIAELEAKLKGTA
jgi:hypothetical protein